MNNHNIEQFIKTNYSYNVDVIINNREKTLQQLYSIKNALEKDINYSCNERNYRKKKGKLKETQRLIKSLNNYYGISNEQKPKRKIRSKVKSYN